MFSKLLKKSKPLAGAADPASDGKRDPWLPPLTSAPLDVVRNFTLRHFFAVHDIDRFKSAVDAIDAAVAPGYHSSDNLIVFARNNSMLDDAAFFRAWERNAESDSDKAIIWRRYVLACAAYHCVQLDGDFVECGAYTGVGVKTVMDYLGGVDFPKVFWAYDAFEHDDSMEHHSMPDHSPQLLERVERKFEGYDQVRLVPGLIPASFEGNLPDRIAYLHIDMNQATAEIAALEALFDRMVPGGILILDDYEWSIYRKQKLAEDPWFESRRYRVMPLPTGQGLVIKR